MKKMILVLPFLLFATVLLAKMKPKKYRNPHEIYYILFTDGCYHLGYEEVIDNQLWWIPYEHGEYLGASLTICVYDRGMNDWC